MTLGQCVLISFFFFVTSNVCARFSVQKINLNFRIIVLEANLRIVIELINFIISWQFRAFIFGVVFIISVLKINNNINSFINKLRIAVIE